MHFLNKKTALMGFIAMILLTMACNKVDDKKAILGIWQIYSINGNGMEIGDGKGYIKFREDGRNEVRTGPGLYEYGRWEIFPEKGEVVLSDDASGAHYQYRMWDDSLVMTMNFPGQITTLRCFKVDKEPVDPFSEGVPADAFK